jgi:3-hydroxy-9,10-secoandrosta-1,3,5(10)-triene-9,17-dione monooxygenase reductase component
VTIHSEHPFLPPEDERSSVRRLRGRLAAAVTLWAADDGERPVGLTVSSMLVADGDPGRVLGLLDPDSELFGAVERSGRFTVVPLGWEHRQLADAFAGVAPAPGGPFRLASWQATQWGPALSGVAWAGCRLEGEPRVVGWGMLVQAAVERVELLADDGVPLIHRRGRYQRLG